MGNSPEKIASLDGLRAFAVVIVMLFHIGFPGFAIGGLGVDLFFALSGFLITHLFLRESASAGTIHLPHFWLRRCLRLMPVYWLYLLIITTLIATGYGELTPHDDWSPNQYIASLWLYFVNYLPAGGLWSEQYLTIHLWSLAVEEQFYLVWPLCAFLLLRYGSMLRGSLIIFAVFVIYYYLLADEFELLKEISGRGIVLFMGCVCAVLCNIEKYKHGFSRLPANRVFLLLMFVFATITAMVYLGYYNERGVKLHFGLLFGVLFCVLIGCLFTQQHTWIHRLLEWGPFVYIGKISYGIYLYHIAVQELVWKFIYPESLFGSVIDYLLKTSIFFVLTLLIASLSFHCFERYFLRFKDKFR